MWWFNNLLFGVGGLLSESWFLSKFFMCSKIYIKTCPKGFGLKFTNALRGFESVKLHILFICTSILIPFFKKGEKLFAKFSTIDPLIVSLHWFNQSIWLLVNCTINYRYTQFISMLCNKKRMLKDTLLYFTILLQNIT